MKNILWFALLAFFTVSCGRFGNNDNKKDQKERIVCISKQYTEIIWALGAQKNIVAVDISSTYPEEVKKLPTVGYHRALSAEGILSMKPTLILHDNNIGPEHVVKQLQELNIPMKTFEKKAQDIESTKNLIREMGNYFDKSKRAEELCKQLDAGIQEASLKRKEYTDTPKVLVIHFGQATNSFLIVTGKSVAGKMVQWAGGKMAVNDDKGMKKLSAEVVAASDPDVILLTSEGMNRLGTPGKVLGLPGIAQTRAAQQNHIYTIDRHDVLYLGPATGKNVMMLQKLIHQGEN